MPKRPNNELLILRYKRKIQKLEEKKNNASRRRRPWIIESDSDSESGVENNEEIETQIPMDTCPVVNNNGLATTEPDDDVMPPDNTLTSDDTQTRDSSSTNLVQPSVSTPQVSNETVPELDEDIRLALGDPAEDTPVFGEKISEYIAERWTPILRKGLSKDLKDKLLKEHNVPENCRLLKAPSLNPEIGSAVADVIRGRDKKIEVRQNQLGQGITAVSKAMTMLINNDGTKHEVIKLLSEGCRILSDLHFIETQVRTKLITPCLDKSFLNITQDEIRDDTLFGNKLSEKIKAAKSIEKQGLQIKRTATVPAKPAPQHQNTSRPRPSENWTRPPRYPSSANRGGRGGAYASRSTQNTNYRRFQALSTPAQSQNATLARPSSNTRQQAVNRSRASTRQ